MVDGRVTLGRKLRTLRRNKNLSLVQASQGIITPQALHKNESGRSCPTPLHLARLADRYGVDLLDFVSLWVSAEPPLRGKIVMASLLWFRGYGDIAIELRSRLHDLPPLDKALLNFDAAEQSIMYDDPIVGLPLYKIAIESAVRAGEWGLCTELSIRYARALRIAQQPHRAVTMLTNLNTIGGPWVIEKQRQLAGALLDSGAYLPAYAEWMSVCRAYADRDLLLAEAESGIGNSLYGLGETEEARKHNTAALKLYETLDLRERVADVLHNEALCARALGRWDEYRALLGESLTLRSTDAGRIYALSEQMLCGMQCGCPTMSLDACDRVNALMSSNSLHPERISVLALSARLRQQSSTALISELDQVLHAVDRSTRWVWLERALHAVAAANWPAGMRALTQMAGSGWMKDDECTTACSSGV